MNSQNEIISVINSGTCVGCGVCALVAPSAVSMRRNSNGAWEAVVTDSDIATTSTAGICPFSHDSPNEDEHAKRLFSSCSQHDSHVGMYKGLWIAHASIGNYRLNGSSGGIASLFLVQAIRNGLVDIVVHVRPSSSIGNLFEYSISKTPEEVMEASKTRYYPATMSTVLQDASQSGLRIALVGVPCFIKAARNLAYRNSSFSDQLVITVSLFCGHMKSSFFSESLAWQIGIPPDRLNNIDFRTKIENKDASRYGFTATSVDGIEKMRPMQKVLGRRWDSGFFRLKACNYCDDVVGETADISLGDAWLPDMVSDWRGHNIVITRSDKADSLFRYLIEKNYVTARPTDLKNIILSQGGGFRDRREGLAYRLNREDQAGRWRPQKRVRADNTHLPVYRKLIYRLRETSRSRSFSSFRHSKSINCILPYLFEMALWNFLIIFVTRIPTLSTQLLNRIRLWLNR